MPIRRSPSGARHPRPQAGRDRPEWVVAINRNGWSPSIVTAGRDHPVRAIGGACIASMAHRGLKVTVPERLIGLIECPRVRRLACRRAARLSHGRPTILHALKFGRRGSCTRELRNRAPPDVGR